MKDLAYVFTLCFATLCTPQSSGTIAWRRGERVLGRLRRVVRDARFLTHDDSCIRHESPFGAWRHRSTRHRGRSRSVRLVEQVMKEGTIVLSDGRTVCFADYGTPIKPPCCGVTADPKAGSKQESAQQQLPVPDYGSSESIDPVTAAPPRNQDETSVIGCPRRSPFSITSESIGSSAWVPRLEPPMRSRSRRDPTARHQRRGCCGLTDMRWDEGRSMVPEALKVWQAPSATPHWQSWQSCSVSTGQRYPTSGAPTPCRGRHGAAQRSGNPEELAAQRPRDVRAGRRGIRGRQARRRPRVGYVRVTSIKCPVTVLHGSSDTVVPPAHAHHTAAIVPGCNIAHHQRSRPLRHRHRNRRRCIGASPAALIRQRQRSRHEHETYVRARRDYCLCASVRCDSTRPGARGEGVLTGAGRDDVRARWIRKVAGRDSVDPALDIDNVQADLWVATAGVGHTFDLAGRQARALAVFPIAWGTIEGSVHEQAQRQDLAGLVDPRLKLSVGLIGAPALSLAEFARAPRRTAVGVSVTVVPPLGETRRGSSSISDTTAGP